jgi:hypothetical protein
MNKQYGLKEVANVIFFNIETNKPEIFFDTLKVSTIENESESAEARGGQGNNKLLSWDFGRTATLTLQDALLSDASLAMLAGNEVQTEGIVAVGRDVLTVTGDAGTFEVELKNAPKTGRPVSIFLAPNGIITEELTVGTVTGTSVTVSGTGAVAGAKVMAFYEYDVTNPDATQVTFSGDKFPATYRVVGQTFGRGRDGKDHEMQFIIPQAKLQSTFSLTMDVENVSVFDFNLEVLVEQGTNKLYDIIRLG